MDGDVDQITFIPTSDERIDWSPLDEPVEDELMDDPLAEDLIPEITLKEDPSYRSEDVGSSEDYVNNESDVTANEVGCDDDYVVINKNVLKAQNNSGLWVKRGSYYENRGNPEILNGMHKDSRIYHDGNGYYFSTNRKAFTNKNNERIRYLRCVKTGCKARGHISDKEGSPMILTYDSHNHRPLSAEEQATKRAKTFAQVSSLPVGTTKKTNSYMKMTDGSFRMVNIDTIKSLPSDLDINNRVNEDLDKVQPTSPPSSERRDLQQLSSVPLRSYQRKAAQVSSGNSKNLEKLNQLSEKKLEKVESITAKLKPILPRPEGGVPVRNSLPKSPSFQIPSPVPQVSTVSDLQRNKPEQNNVLSLSSQVPTQSPSINYSELPSSEKPVVKKRSYVTSCKSEVISDNKNIPVFYHDGRGFAYTLTLYRNHVRYLVCMRNDCKAKARMDAVPAAKILIVSGESHNHKPMTRVEQTLLRENTARRSYSDASDWRNVIKPSENNYDTTITANVNNDTNLNERIASIQKFKMGTNAKDSAKDQSEDNVIIIKQEPENQDLFLDEAGDASHNIDNDLNEESESTVEDNNDNGLGQNVICIPTSEGYSQPTKIKEEILDEAERNNCENSSESADNNEEHNSLKEEVFIKEEEPHQVDEYLSMTVDESDDDDDDDDDNGFENNDASYNPTVEIDGDSSNDVIFVSDPVVIKKEIQDAVSDNSINCVPTPIPLPPSITGINNTNYSTASLESSVTTNQSIGLISSSQQFNEKQAAVSSSISGDNSIVFSANNQNYSSQNQKNLQSLVGIKVPIPKVKRKSRSILEPLNVPVQPQNINYLGLPQGMTNTSQAPSQFQPNVQNAPVLQFSSDNNAINNQNFQYIQLGQNGPFIQIPCQNNTTTNPYGFVMPPQFYPMTPQPLQNNPFIQMVQPGQIDKVATQTIPTIPQNSQMYQIDQNGQNKMNVPQAISTVTGPDGTIYHLVGPTPVTNQVNNNSSPQIQPSQENNVQEINQVSVVKPSTFTSVQPKNESKLILSDNTTTLSQSVVTNDPQTIPGFPQNSQMFQILQNGQNKVSVPQAISTVTGPDGTIYHLVGPTPVTNQTNNNPSPQMQPSQKNDVQKTNQVGASKPTTFTSVQPKNESKLILSDNTTTSLSQSVVTSTPQTIHAIPQNSQMYQIDQNGQSKVGIPQAISTLTGPDGTLYHLVGPAPITNQVNNNSSPRIQPLQKNDVHEINQVSAAKPTAFTSVQQKKKSKLTLCDNTTTSLSQPGQSVQQIDQVSQFQSKSHDSQSTSSIQMGGQILQLAQKVHAKTFMPPVIPSVVQNGQVDQVVEGQVKDISQTLSSQQSGHIFLSNQENHSTSQTIPNVQLGSQVYQSFGSDSEKVPAIEPPTSPPQIIEQNGHKYQLVRNDKEKVPQCIQQGGQIYQLVQHAQGKIFNSQPVALPQQSGQVLQLVQNDQGKVDIPQTVSSVQQSGQVLQLAQNDQGKAPSIQQNGQVLQLVQNDQGKVNISETVPSVQQSGQVLQLVQNDEGKVNIPQTVPAIQQSGQVLQLVQNDQGSVNIPQTVSSVQQNGQVYQFMQNDTGKGTGQLVQCVQQNGQIYQLVQSNQGKLPISQTNSAVEQGGQVFQVLQRGSEKTTASLPFQQIQPNGPIIKVVQGEQGKDVPQNVLQTLQHNGQIYQVLQNSHMKDSPQVASNYKNPVFQLVQNGSDKTQIPQNLANLQKGQLVKYVPDNHNINILKDVKPLLRKIIRGDYKKPKPFSQSQVGKLAQILPKQATTVSSSVSAAPQSITSSANPVSTSPIFRVVQSGSKNISTSQAEVTAVNTPPLQFVQSGQDKCIPQTVSSSQGNIPVQSKQNEEQKDKIPTIIGPNGLVYQMVQSTDAQVKGNGTVYRLIPNDTRDYQFVQGSATNAPSQQIFSPLTNCVSNINNSQIISAVPVSMNNVTSPQIISGIQSGMSNLTNPQIISASANNQIFQVISDGSNNNIITSQSGCAISNNNTIISASNLSNTVSSTHQAAVSTSSGDNTNLGLASNDNSSSIMVNVSDVPSVSVSSASRVSFSQAQSNLSPIVATSGVQLSPSVRSINKSNDLPSRTPASIRNRSEQKPVGQVNKSPSSAPTAVKGYVPIAPAPSPGDLRYSVVNQESYVKATSAAGTKSLGSCEVTPSEQLMGLNDEVIYHDGKGYYYRFERMKYKTKSQPNDQKMLSCIKERCPAVASMTVGEPFSPIRHGLWSHTHNPLSTEEQIERKVKLISFNRMIARARNEKSNTSTDVLRQIFLEEVERFKDVMKMCGVVPKYTLFDVDIYTEGENKFINEVLANELQKGESEGTIAMSVKKRPRAATIHIKPIVDDAIDNADEEPDNDDEFDESYSTDPNTTPKLKRKRGRPRKNKLQTSVQEDFDSLMKVDIGNVKAELVDYDMSENVDSDEMADEPMLQIVTKEEKEDS